MKRRNLLKGIVVVSAGAIIFPACQPKETVEPIPIFDNLAIDNQQFSLIEEISEYILPKKNLNISNPEPTNEFILNMVNDCHSVEDANKYVAGLKQFSHLIQSNFNKTFTELEKDKKEEIFEYISEMKNNQNPMKFFFDTTLGYSKQHFTGSEYFLTKHLDWKFLPGEYKGCEPI